MNGYFIIGIALLCLVVGFSTGWHEKQLRYESSQEKVEQTQADNAAKAQAKIVAKTQVIVRYIHDSKDTCLNRPVPAQLLQQLQ